MTWIDLPVGPVPGAELLCHRCHALLAVGWPPGEGTAAVLGNYLGCPVCGHDFDVRRAATGTGDRKNRAAIVLAGAGLGAGAASRTS